MQDLQPWQLGRTESKPLREQQGHSVAAYVVFGRSCKAWQPESCVDNSLADVPIQAAPLKRSLDNTTTQLATNFCWKNSRPSS